MKFYSFAKNHLLRGLKHSGSIFTNILLGYSAITLFNYVNRDDAKSPIESSSKEDTADLKNDNKLSNTNNRFILKKTTIEQYEIFVPEDSQINEKEENRMELKDFQNYLLGKIRNEKFLTQPVEKNVAASLKSNPLSMSNGKVLRRVIAIKK